MKKQLKKDDKAKEKPKAGELAQRYDPKEAEPRIQKFWEQQGIFKFNPRSKKTVFSIDTPPPTVSGLIHMGHALSYTTAEFIARFWRMQGYEVFYPMGFDDNGLPSERYVEKARGIRSIDYSREEFIKICLEETKKGGEDFKKVWKALGISVDWSLLYSTINPFCQKLSQLSFIDIYKKGRVYRQEGPTAWCPVCQTAIAQAELEDAQRKSFLNTIFFDLVGGEKIKIATTRPELLAACVAVFVHPNDERYKNLVGKRAIVPVFGQEVSLAADEKVDPEFGTGIVMVCTFGDRTDIEWWQKHKLPLRIVIDKRGRLNESAGKFKGLKLEEARKQIIADLEKEGKLIEKKEIEQNVNVHERCGTPVEFYISPQWYIRILDLKEKFLELGEQISWHPEHMKIRYKQWVEGLNSDWCISRQRFYGIPFPVWHCKKCRAIVLAEEKELPIDPTKVKKKCACGGETLPDTDVMDTWATSAITPLINAKWKEKKNLMDKIYPMNLRPQGYEIIRTWAFYTIAKCWLHTGQIPWKSVMINGMGLDPHGKKMSKSKGNVVEPLPVKEKYSADAIRFWATSARLGEDLPYQEKDVATGQKLLTKLWNASRLVSEHIKDYKGKKPKELAVIDKWLLSRLVRIVKSATENFKVCEYSQAKSETDIFFWHDFCDNYLEMVKYRLYAGKDKSAQYTLYTSLLTILKLFAPIIPHITEEIYQKLFRKKEKSISLHISDWPEPDNKLIDIEAEEAGELAKQVVSGLRQYKSSRKMPLNAELKRIIIECDAEAQKRLDLVAKDIRGTMKVGLIEFGKALEFAKESEIALDKIKINVFI